jgi:polar amino acid transport system substrate-binding protein
MACLVLGACGLPRDPEGTSEAIEGKVRRAGVSDNPPWVSFDGREPQGLEADLVRGLAAQMHARIAWKRGGESTLLKDLKEHRYDIVVGGMTTESPWTKELGAARPYATVAKEKHLVLVPPGENRWLLTVDRDLAAHHDQLQARARAEAGL